MCAIVAGTTRQLQLRMHWMDLLRGTAVLLVVVWHVPSIPAAFGADPPPALTPILSALAPYRVPMLLFLSGMLLPRSLSKGMAPYYEGKVRAVAWPYVVWTLLSAAALGNLQGLSNPWRWVGGSYHLWFLAVLMACYLVGPLTRIVPAWAWVIPMVLLSPVPSTNAYARILWFGAFFYAGAAAAKHVGWWQGRRPWAPTLLGAIAIAYGAWVAISGSEPGDKALIYFLPSLAGIGAIVWVAPKLPRVAWLERAGKSSIVIYLAHFPVIGVAWLALSDEAGSPYLGWWPTLALLLAVGVLVPWALRPLQESALFRAPTWLRLPGKRDARPSAGHIPARGAARRDSRGSNRG